MKQSQLDNIEIGIRFVKARFIFSKMFSASHGKTMYFILAIPLLGSVKIWN